MMYVEISKIHVLLECPVCEICSLQIVQGRDREKVISKACKSLAIVVKDHDHPRAVGLAEVRGISQDARTAGTLPDFFSKYQFQLPFLFRNLIGITGICCKVHQHHHP